MVPSGNDDAPGRGCRHGRNPSFVWTQNGLSAAPPASSPIRFEYGVWVGATETNDQARVWRADKSFTVTSAADCAQLPSPYFTRLCATLVGRTWRDIAILDQTPGPSLEMYARLTRAALDGDLAVCSDPTVNEFVGLGLRLESSAAQKSCESTITRRREAGFMELLDQSTTFNEKILLLRLSWCAA